MGDSKGPAFSSALMAGACSGLSVDLLFYPIDTIKTRLQASQGFLAAGGFSGIYKGLGSVAVGSAPGAATFFVTYETLKPVLRDMFPSVFRVPSAISGNDGSIMGRWAAPILHMASASMAETAACLIRVPTEVIKSRQQTLSYGSTVSTWEAFRTVGRESGLRGYYRGFASTVGREIPFTCIQFPLYESFKLHFTNRRRGRRRYEQNPMQNQDSRGDLTGFEVALSGSAAGAIAAALTTPLDVAKTRIMLHKQDTTSATSHPLADVNKKIVPTLKHIMKIEGPGALFRGIVPRTLWIGLGGAVFLGTFELGLSVLEPPSDRPDHL
ncbi:mitochondrial carrier [Tilletiaria anomala UBC 951]|uniref:Mitochondrial carrier n=1 Tax=Tilletiaria anomala (strain ATCC 24038 / CBS 436.72 / UBC 951) TaxID=1037660 RepID=A0A066VNM8_TILAU|nr:mitochondrial carrier [Tilletiaria anomala UBC 951]KDN43096.1 mitochondrial carrier [Tilletiaria anomala UBC 951]